MYWIYTILILNFIVLVIISLRFNSLRNHIDTSMETLKDEFMCEIDSLKKHYYEDDMLQMDASLEHNLTL